MRLLKGVCLWILVPSFLLAMVLYLSGVREVSLNGLTGYLRSFLNSQAVNQIAIPLIPSASDLLGETNGLIEALNAFFQFVNCIITLFNTLITALKILVGFVLWLVNAPRFFLVY